jgi:hypothetical protein
MAGHRGGLGAGVGTFLAMGMTPLATTPTGRADRLDLIVDAIMNSPTSLADPAAALDPAAVDLGGLDVSLNPLVHRLIH